MFLTFCNQKLKQKICNNFKIIMPLIRFNIAYAIANAKCPSQPLILRH